MTPAELYVKTEPLELLGWDARLLADLETLLAPPRRLQVRDTDELVRLLLETDPARVTRRAA